MTHLLKWAIWVPLFIVPFLPLYVADGLFFPFITGKGFAFRILVEIAFASWVVLAIADKAYRPRFSWTLVLFGLFTAWMAIANFFAVNPHKAFWSNFERMDGWVTLIHVFAFFLVTASVFAVDKLWRKWWLFFLSSSVIVFLHAGCQILVGAPTCVIHQGGVRVDANFGNAIYLAAYLLFAIGIAAWQMLVAKGWFRYVLGALVVGHSFVLFATTTRGAIIGFVAALFIGALLWCIGKGSTQKRVAAGFLIALTVLTVAFFFARNTPLVQHDPTLSRLSSISLKELETRFTLWGMAGQAILERPITGWGQEGYNYVFNTYYQPSLYAQEAWFDRAHNMYIDWAVAGGIPALLLLLALLFTAMVALYRHAPTHPERVIFVAIFVAYGIQALAEFDNLFTYVPLAVLFAMAHGYSSRPVPFFEKMRNGDALATQVSFAAASILLVVALWQVNISNMQAGGEIIKALAPGQNPTVSLEFFKSALARNPFASQEIREQLASYAGAVSQQGSIPEATRMMVAQFAAEQMNEELKRAPNDARLLYQSAVFYHSFGDLQNAHAYIEAAIAKSPQKQMLYFERGVQEMQAGDAPTARKTFDYAYSLNPSYGDAAVYAAAGAMLAGDISGGNKILLTQFGTTTVDQNILFYAYYVTKQYDALIAARALRVANEQGSVSSRFGLAGAYVVAGRIPDAIAEIQATIAAHPEAAAQGASLLAELGVK